MLGMFAFVLDMQTNNITLTTSMGGSATPPIINIQHPPPPAISVVTFRWDSIKHTKGAPDR